MVLYEDSSVIWFRDRDRLDPEGGIFLRDAPEMLAAGQVSEAVSGSYRRLREFRVRVLCATPPDAEREHSCTASQKLKSSLPPS